jgi:outer membrane lipopolysaccharide assembly protein LptE/RlpB
MRPNSLLFRAAAVALALGYTACGYHMAGRGDRLPPNVKTIAVPIFTNQSKQFRIEQTISAAVTRELIERTRFRVTPDPAAADAVLQGTIKDVQSGVITFDLNTGRATALQVVVTASVNLADRHTHKVLFSNSGYVFREEYQISQSTSQLFEEQGPALKRLAADFAHTLVTDILENF